MKTVTASIIIKLSAEDYSLWGQGAFERDTCPPEATEVYKAVNNAIEEMHVTGLIHGLDLGGCVEIQQDCSCPVDHVGVKAPVEVKP